VRAPEELEGPDVGADPAGQVLALGGLGKGVAAGAQHGDKDRRLAYFARLWVYERDGVAGIIDEQLLASPVLLAQHHVQAPMPAPVQLAKAAVAVAVRVRLAVLVPHQLQRQVRVGL
jgi:hypothetical protein